MTKIMFPEVRGVLNDLNEKLAGANARETLNGLKKLLREQKKSDAKAEGSGKIVIAFGWMFAWAEKLNAIVSKLPESEKFSFMRDFIVGWESFHRGPSGIHVFSEISSENREAFLNLLEIGVKPACDDHDTKAVLGMRLMYTWARNNRNGDGLDEFRCWFGIPFEFIGGHTESDRKGLLFTITAESADIERIIPHLLTSEDIESGFDIETRSTPTTVYGLLVDRKRFGSHR